KLENFFLSIGELDASRREYLAGRRGNTIDEDRHHATWSPHRSLVHDPDGLDKLRRTGTLVDVAFCAGSESFENRLIICAGTRDNDAQVGTRGFEASHHVKDAGSAAAAIAQQDQIDVRQRRKFFQRSGGQLQIGLFVKKGTKPDKAERIAVNHSDMNHWLFGGGGFHVFSHNGTGG